MRKKLCLLIVGLCGLVLLTGCENSVSNSGGGKEDDTNKNMFVCTGTEKKNDDNEKYNGVRVYLNYLYEYNENDDEIKNITIQYKYDITDSSLFTNKQDIIDSILGLPICNEDGKCTIAENNNKSLIINAVLNDERMKYDINKNYPNQSKSAVKNYHENIDVDSMRSWSCK